MPPKDVGDPKAEAARLRAKIATIQDRDIRAAIQEKIDALSAQVVEPEPPEASLEPQTPPPPPTPEQSEQAEKLVRHAMLEKQRGNKARVTELLQQAVAVAPGAPATLEALGDDFTERSRPKEAMDCYKRAMVLDPKNVGLEKKHAMLVFNVGAAGSIDDQLRANLSDSFLPTSSDHATSLRVARFVTYFMPGLGHVLLGRPAMGFGLLGGWVGCLAWVAVARNVSGKSGGLGLSVYLPAFIALIILITALTTLGSQKAAAKPKSGPPRPKPPVDLPFD